MAGLCMDWLKAGARDERCWLAWGLASAVVYVAVVTLLVGSLPTRLLFDGLLPPPPYHWVNPSAHPASIKEPAEAGAGVLMLGARGSEAGEIGTDDGQALVTFPTGAVAPQPGESSVKVRITPLDPATVAPAPRGHPFDGNAYRVEASYAASGKPAVLAASLTVVLRFPVQATEILRFLGPEWDILRATTGYHQVLANTDRLGIFVAAAAPAESTLSRIILWAFYCGAGVGLIWLIVRAVRARGLAARSRPV